MTFVSVKQKIFIKTFIIYSLIHYQNILPYMNFADTDLKRAQYDIVFVNNKHFKSCAVQCNWLIGPIDKLQRKWSVVNTVSDS